MQAKLGSDAAQESAHLGQWVNKAWMRLMARLSGLSTLPTQPSKTSGAAKAEVPSPSSKEEMLLVAADMLRRHTQVTMLVVAIRDLPELQDVFGHAAARQVIQIAARKLGSLTWQSRVMQTAPAVMTTLFPGWVSQQAINAVSSAFGTPCCIELEVEGQEVVLFPEIAALTVSRETLSIGQVYDDLCRADSSTHPRHRHHSQNHRALARRDGREATQCATNRREPHARTVVTDPRFGAYAPMAPTMPVQLGAR